MAESSFVIEFNADAAERAMKRYPSIVQRGVARAVNRALTSGRALMATLIAKDMGMKSRDAKEAVLVDEAKPTNLSARLRASRKRRPLYDFGARQTARGVSFRAQSGRQVVPGAFVVGVQTGHAGTSHVGVFKRRGKKRLPIYELFGVSIGHVFDRHKQTVTDKMREAFEKNLAHELEFATKEGDRAK